MVVNNVNSLADKGTELSGLASKGAVETGILKELEKQDTKQQIQQPGMEKAGLNKSSNLLDGRNAMQKGNQILVNLLGSLASLGHSVSLGKLVGKNNQQSIKDEYDMMFGNRTDEGDNVHVSSKDVKEILKYKGGQRQNQGQNQWQKAAQMPESTKAELGEYAGLYADMLVNTNDKTREKLKNIEQKLLKEDVNPQDLQTIKNQVMRAMRGKVIAMVKDVFVKQLLSKEKTMENMMHQKAYSDLADFAFNDDRFGGWDWGNYKSAADAQVEARGEVRDFVQEEIKEYMISKKIKENILEGKDENAEEKWQELAVAANKTGVDFEVLFKSIGHEINELGLIPCLMFEEFAPNADASSDSDQKKNQYSYDSKDEQEILINKLRVVYLQRAMHAGSIRKVIETGLKMRKMKDGLIKLGVSSEEFLKIEKEGQALAICNMLRQLQEAFNERATLVQLKGTAFNLVEKRIKAILRNLGRLGYEFSQTDIDAVRDKSNERMRQEAVEELKAVACVLQTGKYPWMQKKEKMLIKIINRLTEESNLSLENVSEEVVQLLEANQANILQGKIREAA